MRTDFAILILSHGRANNVITIKTLADCGYTGNWYIVIDDEDNQEELYYKNFGKEHIIKFSKEEISKKFDIMDNFEGKKVPTYARNAFWEIAKNLNLTYFLELEDDYLSFNRRYLENGKLKVAKIKNLDSIIDEMIIFLDNSNALTVAFAQAGDLIGGVGSAVWTKKLTRKAMNCFFCRTDRPFNFLGRFNDDVNAYVEYGKKGGLFFTIRDVVMNQPITQTQQGGITESYKKYGTYVKSFYSVMLNPSAVKIYTVGTSHKRIHHIINWEYAVPKIINERYKKI